MGESRLNERRSDVGGSLGLVGRAAEIEGQRIALLLDHDMDAHRLLQLDAVVVDEPFRLKASVRPLRDRRLELALGDVQQMVAAAAYLVAAELGDQLAEPSFAQSVGAELAADIAEHQLGRAAVGGDQPLEIGVRATPAVVAHGGKMQALVEDLPRLSGAASGHRTADVALMRDRAAEDEQGACA